MQISPLLNRPVSRRTFWHHATVMNAAAVAVESAYANGYASTVYTVEHDLHRLVPRLTLTRALRALVRRGELTQHVTAAKGCRVLTEYTPAGGTL